MWRRVALLAVVLLTVGCGDDHPTTSPLVEITPAPMEAQAIEWRETVGLRSDLPWVRAVSNDPDAVANASIYGFPVTRVELAWLREHQASWEEIVEYVSFYGRSRPEVWAGDYFDAEKDVLVARFTDALDEHEQALREKLGPDAKFELRLARWSLKELEGFMATVEAERDWFTSLAGARYVWPKVNLEANAIDLNLYMDTPTTTIDLALDHFGRPPWLRIVDVGPVPPPCTEDCAGG